MSRDLRLGRILLPTIFDDLKEAVGGQLDTAGATVTVGEGRPRPFSFTVPIHGLSEDTDPYAAATRARRQLRSLMNNPDARNQGVWFEFAADPELNGWLRIGSADLEYDTGGITMGDFKLSLSDCFRVASPRTHRVARRLEAYDRRLSTTPRDYRGTVFSTDFAAQVAEVRHYLPVGAADIVGAGNRVVSPSVRASIEGDIPYLVGAAPGEAVSFEQPSFYRHMGDVVLTDRRGI